MLLTRIQLNAKFQEKRIGHFCVMLFHVSCVRSLRAWLRPRARTLMPLSELVAATEIAAESHQLILLASVLCFRTLSLLVSLLQTRDFGDVLIVCARENRRPSLMELAMVDFGVSIPFTWAWRFRVRVGSGQLGRLAVADSSVNAYMLHVACAPRSARPPQIGSPAGV